MNISHNSLRILILTIILILSSCINMCCEIGDIRELFLKYSLNKELQFTIVLTEPNDIRSFSQLDGTSFSAVLVDDRSQQAK